MSDPLESAASATTVISERPLIIRFRCGKFAGRGGVPGGNSVIISPFLIISERIVLASFRITYIYTAAKYCYSFSFSLYRSLMRFFIASHSHTADCNYTVSGKKSSRPKGYPFSVMAGFSRSYYRYAPFIKERYISGAPQTLRRFASEKLLAERGTARRSCLFLQIFLPLYIFLLPVMVTNIHINLCHVQILSSAHLHPSPDVMMF